jgi:ankyrin repeat protein
MDSSFFPLLPHLPFIPSQAANATTVVFNNAFLNFLGLPIVLFPLFLSLPPLQEEGADVMIPDKDGRMPLHLASQNGHTEVDKMLVENGADVTVADNDGLTPLHLASESGHIMIAKVLVEKRADVAVANKDGWTPLHLAS